MKRREAKIEALYFGGQLLDGGIDGLAFDPSRDEDEIDMVLAELHRIGATLIRRADLLAAARYQPKKGK